MTAPAADNTALIAALRLFSDTTDKLIESMKLMRSDIRESERLRRLLLLTVVLDLCVTIATAVIITVTVHSSHQITQIERNTEAIRVCAVRGQDQSLDILNACVHRVLAAPSGTK